MAKTRGKKSALPIWILYIVCGVLTVALVVTCLWLFVFSEDARPSKAKEENAVVDIAWQQLDAVVLATTIDDVYQEDVLGGTLTTVEEQLQLSVAIRKNAATEPSTLTFALSDPAVESTANKAKGSIKELTYAVLKNVDGETLLAYADHLDEYGVTVLKSLQEDIDKDGKAELVYVVRGLVDAWAEDTEYQDLLRPLCNQPVCLYIDTEGDAAVVRGLALYGNISDVQTVSWADGVLRVSYAEVNGKVWETSLFAPDYASTTADYTTDTDALSRIGTQYATYLNDDGYEDVAFDMVDVSEVAGNELMYTYRDGSWYYFEVVSARSGNMDHLYTVPDVGCSVFLVERDGVQYLFEFTKEPNGKNMDYAYALFRLGANGETSVKEGNSITVAVGEEYQNAKDFFETVKGYVKGGISIIDNYELLPWLDEILQDPKTESTTNFLRITNCSTVKKGIVTLKDADGYLNFRTAPSTSASLVLTDPSDKDSYIKPRTGDEMTVICPHNTDDSDNPIWLELSVRHHGKTLVGYSAQQFVRTDSIRNVTVGERLTITTETDQTGLSWTCSDTSVATVDANGALTAHRAGMVLVTVTAANGLEDSCLIMVNATGEGDAR